MFSSITGFDHLLEEKKNNLQSLVEELPKISCILNCFSEEAEDLSEEAENPDES